jgi:Fe-S cluster biogenesis protein NfuA
MASKIECTHPERLGGRDPADCSAEQRRACHPPKSKEDKTPEGDNILKEKVEAEMAKIRPSLQADGGDAELVEVNEKTGIVKIRLTGHCAGCPMSQMTLKNGIERILKGSIPEVKSVIAV